MRHWHEYIKKLEDEIDKIVKEEAEDGLMEDGEELLHCLFENRKHAKEYLACMEAERGTQMGMSAGRPAG